VTESARREAARQALAGGSGSTGTSVARRREHGGPSGGSTTLAAWHFFSLFLLFKNDIFMGLLWWNKHMFFSLAANTKYISFFDFLSSDGDR
jgi:hypothetical protein